MSHRCTVCGKEIAAGEEVARVEERERVYYLCSDECLQRFEEDPEEYDAEWGEEEDRREVF